MSENSIQIGTNGDVYIAGEFTSLPIGDSEHIAHWNGDSWSAVEGGHIGPITYDLDYFTEKHDMADTCFYCGSSTSYIGDCPKCGAPPRIVRSYSRGEIVLHKGLLHRFDDWIKARLAKKRQPIKQPREAVSNFNMTVNTQAITSQVAADFEKMTALVCNSRPKQKPVIGTDRVMR